MAKSLNLKQRPRRNRRTSEIRDLVAESTINLNSLVLPFFVEEGKNVKTSIKTLPGLFRYSSDALLVEIEECLKLGLRSFALFPQISDALKDQTATEVLNKNGLIPRLLAQIKKNFPEVVLFSDVALDPYSSDGHDGIVRNGKIINDESVEILKKMALVQAQAGADYVAPSDMMDGRVGAIRNYLDEHGFQDVGIMAYSAKYASSFYGPFRDALQSAPKAGDKKTYQMDFRNRREALREVKLDLNEGADMVMVKPAFAYLDVISEVKKISSVPVAAYNVSGEYAMIKFAAQNGALNEDMAMLEMLTAIRRAGADVIFTYFAKQYAMSFK